MAKKTTAPPATRKFGGKVYKYHTFRLSKGDANKAVAALRRRGILARIVARPKYPFGGWSIYTRGTGLK